jgi:hypothetical protein
MSERIVGIESLNFLRHVLKELVTRTETGNSENKQALLGFYTQAVEGLFETRQQMYTLVTRRVFIVDAVINPIANSVKAWEAKEVGTTHNPYVGNTFA